MDIGKELRVIEVDEPMVDPFEIEEVEVGESTQEIESKPGLT